MNFPANYAAWALGQQRSNGFSVRRIVWGLLMAQTERRPNEEIRRATILVEAKWRPRHPKPRTEPAPSEPGEIEL